MRSGAARARSRSRSSALAADGLRGDPNCANVLLRLKALVKRAAVLIGVNRSGQLPELHDAVDGAKRMAAWAKEQGFDPILPFTDDDGDAVEIGDIKKAIFKIVDDG